MPSEDEILRKLVDVAHQAHSSKHISTRTLEDFVGAINDFAESRRGNRLVSRKLISDLYYGIRSLEAELEYAGEKRAALEEAIGAIVMAFDCLLLDEKPRQ